MTIKHLLSQHENAVGRLGMLEALCPEQILNQRLMESSITSTTITISDRLHHQLTPSLVNDTQPPVPPLPVYRALTHHIDEISQTPALAFTWLLRGRQARSSGAVPGGTALAKPASGAADLCVVDAGRVAIAVETARTATAPRQPFTGAMAGAGSGRAGVVVVLARIRLH